VTELETLPAIRHDEAMREIVARMAHLACRHRLGEFARDVAADPVVGVDTKAWIGAVATDEPCLHAVETDISA
jgi:hypothetical protein